MGQPLDPIQIEPLDDTGAIVADGTYALGVSGGIIQGLVAGGGAGGSVESIVAGTGISVDDTDPANPVVSATGGGGGGGGGTGYDRRWNVGPGETSVDEFNDSSLAAAWTRVDGTGAVAGNLTWAEGADSLSVRSTGGDSASAAHGLVRPLTGAGGPLAVGDGFVTAVTNAGSTNSYSIFGIALTDGNTHGSGNQMWASADFSAPNFGLRRMTNWTSQASSGGSASTWPHRGLIYLRLAWVASTSWRMDTSNDGVQWLSVGAALTFAFTPTHVGFMDSSWGGTHSRITSYEFLRRVSGVT